MLLIWAALINHNNCLNAGLNHLKYVNKYLAIQTTYNWLIYQKKLASHNKEIYV